MEKLTPKTKEQNRYLKNTLSNLTSQSKFATQCGVKRQFISQEIKTKPYIIDMAPDPRTGKAKVDLDGINTIAFLLKHKQKNQQKEQQPDQPPAQPPRQPANPTGYNGAPNFGTKQELEVEKLKESVEKLRIDNEKKRGSLIPKRLIKLVFGKLYSIDSNQFKTLGVSASPEISDVYNEENDQKTEEILKLFGKEEDKNLKKNISKILNSGEEARMLKTSNVLEDKTSKILKSIKRIFDDFLKNIKKLEE